MIKITYDEARHLRDKGFKNYVNKSYSKNPTYYAVEAPKVIAELNKYRASRVIGGVWFYGRTDELYYT